VRIVSRRRFRRGYLRAERLYDGRRSFPSSRPRGHPVHPQPCDHDRHKWSADRFRTLHGVSAARPSGPERAFRPAGSACSASPIHPFDLCAVDRCRAGGRSGRDPARSRREEGARHAGAARRGAPFVGRRRPRARVPRRRDLLRIQGRAALGASRRGPGHRQPRQVGPVPQKLLRRRLSAQPILLRPRSRATADPAFQPALENRGRSGAHRRQRAPRPGRAQVALLPRALRVAELEADEPGRDGREPRLLSI
ncbi:MAG: Cell wall hydrolyses involved in spore germination, partial [uncultured Sphingomonadaceae bacterium]